MRPRLPLVLFLLSCSVLSVPAWPWDRTSSPSQSSVASGQHWGLPRTKSTPVFDPRIRRFRHPHSDPHPNFDFYVLALSWQPSFCHSCPPSGCPGCLDPKPFWRSHFTLHGLWPEYENASYPENCDGDEFDAREIEDALGMATLEEFWPNVKAPDDARKYPAFWRHEWERHGTCSGLDPVQFFRTAVDMVRNNSEATPDAVRTNVGRVVSTPDVRSSFPKKVVLKCSNKDEPGELAQAFVCWSMDEKHVPSEIRDCPDSMRREDTCVDSEVRIRAFPGLDGVDGPEDQDEGDNWGWPWPWMG